MLSANMKFIWTSCRNRKKGELLKKFLSVSMRDLINLIFDDNVHVYNACHAFTKFLYLHTKRQNI